MRHDMDKVLCERPRTGGRVRKRRRRYRGPLEDAPRFESTSRNRGGDKYPAEHLGPLRRWLVRQVGRHWDDVYADLRANISPNNAVQLHIWFHAELFVAKDVVLEDGVTRRTAADPRGRRGEALHRRQNPVYICPKTGVLLRTPDAANEVRRARKKAFAEGRAKARRGR